MAALQIIAIATATAAVCALPRAQTHCFGQDEYMGVSWIWTLNLKTAVESPKFEQLPVIL
jgi:hypothetical protein